MMSWADAGRRLAAERNRVLSSLRRGDLTVYEVLRDRPDCILDMPVHRVISAARGIGVMRMIAIADEASVARVNLFVPVVALSARQRAWVASRCG